jgi:hypothetical protein
MTLKRMFDKFQAVYAKEDKILQLFFLNFRILESEIPEEVGMEDGACMECLNFLKFFSGRNLAEIDGCNTYFHFVLRLVEHERLIEAVGLLQADGTFIKIVRDGDEESVEEYPCFMIRPSMVRALF